MGTSALLNPPFVTSGLCSLRQEMEMQNGFFSAALGTVDQRQLSSVQKDFVKNKGLTTVPVVLEAAYVDETDGQEDE